MLQHKTLSDKNREIIADFVGILYEKRDVRKAFETYVTEDYIQHNPDILDGREIAIQSIEEVFANMVNYKICIRAILSDGDQVVVHGHGYGEGAKSMVVVDIFRLVEGKIVEHWDVIQEVPEQKSNPRTMW